MTLIVLSWERRSRPVDFFSATSRIKSATSFSPSCPRKATSIVDPRAGDACYFRGATGYSFRLPYSRMKLTCSQELLWREGAPDSRPGRAQFFEKCVSVRQERGIPEDDPSRVASMPVSSRVECSGMLVLGIESSCDETAAAVVEQGRVIRSSIVASQVETHTPFG